MKAAIRDIAFVLAICFSLANQEQAVADGTSESTLPNIVFFLVDDLGWRDLGCYGSSFYETPRIDQFAAESMRFTSAYAACHVCSPTRASIMTGKYPAKLQLTDWLPGRKEFDFQKLENADICPALPLDEVTIAEHLRSIGYQTGHFGKWHLGEDPNGPLNQGFDVQVPRWNKGWPKAGYHAPFQLEGLEDHDGDYLTDRLTDEALRFIDTNSKQPFFLYLSHFAVHDPIQGRDDLVRKYQRKLQAAQTQDTSASGADNQPYLLEGNPDSESATTAEERLQLLNRSGWSGYKVLPKQMVKIKQRQDNVQFAAMLESMDESFGRVLDKLHALNLTERTVVIFFSDNGGMAAANFGRPDRRISPEKLDLAYSTSNLPLRGAKGWLYEGGIRVPLLIRWPQKTKPGTTCDVPVISNDFFPTIQHITRPQAPLTAKVDGTTLVPLLTGTGDLKREAIYWHFPHYSNHGMQSPGGAIRMGDFKLLEYFENGSVQLFNLRDDISEQHDLSKAMPDKVEEMRTMLKQWRMRVGAAMPEEKL
ncbi:sulfatase [Stieleria sp. JC731]|uniref:sulfatase n=1 Tax=Pirellulaceae TaxID=2691357 RepID=UPI001E41F100|nr:sulfatase [Stieleria sp. JC731]MCC9603565.1 sulfatase [Stieleria sp. JC731]